jgi:hypothetical protein
MTTLKPSPPGRLETQSGESPEARRTALLEFVQYLQSSPPPKDAEWWEKLRADIESHGVYFGQEE